MTANTAPIETLESPWMREPIHSASSGLPVQMLIATTAIAASSPARLTRAPRPRVLSLSALIDAADATARRGSRRRL